MSGAPEDPPPILGRWRTVHLVVLGNLVFWVLAFLYLTERYQ